MQNRAPDLINERLEGWTPSGEAQQIIFWRILQLMMARYGSVPLGQLLVGMTATVLNELGHAPTVTELCEATGLPKSSISRYISAQMEQGVIRESIDPRDRRRRMLEQTDDGKAERRWQIKHMRKILEDVHAWDSKRLETGQPLDPEKELAEMQRVAANAAEEFKQRRKRGRRAVA